MRVKLLAQHFIDGRLYERGEALELPEGMPVTPQMEGLDVEALDALSRVPRRRPFLCPPVTPLRGAGFGPR